MAGFVFRIGTGNIRHWKGHTHQTFSILGHGVSLKIAPKQAAHPGVGVGFLLKHGS